LISRRHAPNRIALHALGLLALLAGCQLVADIQEKNAIVGGDAGSCTTNQSCIDANGGNPAICRRPDRTCQSVLSPDCPRLIGSVADDETILFGLVQDLRGSNAGTGIGRVQGAELAVTEITQTTRGIPGGADGRPRPIAIVACSENPDATSPADPKVPARFLIDTLHVPCILGAGNSGTTIDLATNVTLPGKVLLFSPSATSEAITGLQPAGDTPRLVWRTAPSNTIQAVALRLQVGALESDVRAQRGATTVKLAVVVKGDAFGTGLWGLAQEGMTIDGLAVTSPSNPYVLVRQYAATAVASDIAPIATAVLQFGPDIVLSIGTGEAVAGVLSPVEAGWLARNPGRSPPQWLFTNGGQSTPLLSAAASEASDLRARVRGTAPGERGPLYDAFLLRYGEVYPDGPAVTFGAAGSYDIVYMLAYAAFAAPPSDPPGAPLTGTRVAEGLLDVVTGDPASSTIAVGPQRLSAAFQALASGNAIKFTGASGPLDFDPQTGEAPSDIDVWCISQQGAPAFRSSGVYYSAASSSLIGTFACPAF
jgi:branched-chain amino acid transport system substrate-binding protein